MGDRLEVYRWHRQYAEAWTEKRPVPIEMSDEEMFQWLGEYCDMLVYKRPTPEYGGSFIVYCDEVRTVAPTLSEAVQMAAAKLEEAS